MCFNFLIIVYLLKNFREPYNEQLMEAFKSMVEIYEANENTPLWESLGTKE